MRSIKKYLLGAIVGLTIGLWFGVNIGEGRPLWANPFAEKNITEKAKGVATDAIKGAKKAARDKLAD